MLRFVSYAEQYAVQCRDEQYCNLFLERKWKSAIVEENWTSYNETVMTSCRLQ